MIHKKTGARLIEKLGVTHLFEADHDFDIVAVFGRLVMHSGVNNHALHSSQWAQPGRGQRSDLAITRKLTLEASKMTKKPLAGFENSALACHNRIAMNLTLAVFDQLGVPPGPTRISRNQEMLLAQSGPLSQDRLWHLHPVLREQRNQTDLRSWARQQGWPHHLGCGQLSPIRNSRCHFTGLTFQNPCCTLTHKRRRDGFVNDATTHRALLAAWLQAAPTLLTAFNGPLNNLQTWEQLLWASCGLLSLEKRAFWILCWKFAADGQGSLMTKAELEAPLRGAPHDWGHR